MKKINFKSELFSWIILFAVIILSVWAYPQLPERVSSHWNLQGEVDGWSSRKFHSLFFPILTIVMYFGLLFMPLLDPKKERYQEFIKTYTLIRHALLFVMGAIFFAATFFNLGYNINIGAIVGALVGALMIFLGNYFGKIKRNWFIGKNTLDAVLRKRLEQNPSFWWTFIYVVGTRHDVRPLAERQLSFDYYF